MSSLTVAIVGLGQMAFGFLSAIACAIIAPKFVGLALLEGLFGTAVFIAALLFEAHRILSDRGDK